MTHQESLYAEVILPLAFGKTFSYLVPEEWRANICVGQLVEVPFGAKAFQTGIVLTLQPTCEQESFVIKPIRRTIGNQAVVTEIQLIFWQWMASYYLCSLGEVMRAALPAKLKDDLIKKGVLDRIEKAVSATVNTSHCIPPKALSPEQAVAKEQIQRVWKEKEVCLLHGYTSSGKTEIYIHLIEDCLQQGKQVLYLLPEIALTTQITHRLKRVFGDRMGVYHSAATDSERTALWKNLLLDEGCQLVVGVRSSVFLPFKRLGLIIVDEEHESSYKQQHPAPRYHARNVALMLARLSAAKTLLGTATPSIESYNKAREGHYGLVELFSRYQQVNPPEIILADVQDLRKKKLMKSIFSPILIEKMRESIDKNEQILLFQNRRGYAPVVSCKQCGWTPRCPRCEVSMTFHKQKNRFRCHYCGKEATLSTTCPVCGSKQVGPIGFGTEKVEEELKKLFPSVRIARMDSDMIHTKLGYETVIRNMEQGQTDVLIGTQMLTKGLDFDRLGVVGILSADALLTYPDFRAHERAFQTMLQVSGRAGRKKTQATVVVQTIQASHPLFQEVVDNDYASFFLDEMRQRQLFSYPPYSYLIDIWFKHRNLQLLTQAAESMVSNLQQALPESVFGPFAPAVSRIRNICIQKVSLKISPKLSLKKIKEYLFQSQEALRQHPAFKSVQVYFDVDPLF